jgi:DhnA family fructose-bisphosphate aldolase class Ia
MPESPQKLMINVRHTLDAAMRLETRKSKGVTLLEMKYAKVPCILKLYQPTSIKRKKENNHMVNASDVDQIWRMSDFCVHHHP